jgi:RimJ/RimL family protein N-acetyltransferase
MLKLRKAKHIDFEFLCDLHTSKQTREFLGGPLSSEAAALKADSIIQSIHGSYFIIEVDHVAGGLISFTSHVDLCECELSYQLLPEFVKKGIAYRAIRNLIRRTAYPICAETQLANVASRKLLKKLGFVEVEQLNRFGSTQVIVRLPQA